MDRGQRIQRLYLLVDLLAYFAAYQAAKFLRFQIIDVPWMRDYYQSVLVASLLLLALVLFSRQAVGKHRPESYSDPLDIAVDTFKTMVLLMVSLSIYLFVTHTSARISRLFAAILFVCGLLTVFAARLVSWYVLKKLREKDPERGLRPCIVAAEASRLEQAKARLLVGEQGIRIAGEMALVSPFSEEDIAGMLPAASGSKYMAYCMTEGLSKEEILLLERVLTSRGISMRVALSVDGIPVPRSAVVAREGAAFVRASALGETCDILGVRFRVTNVGEAVFYVRRHLEELRGSYICFSNVHTTVMAKESGDYAAVQNGSALTFADGMPIAKREYSLGHVRAERVSGPDFMGQLFLSSMDGKVRHFFYGSTEETIALLKKNLPEKYPGIVICGACSPPFRPLSAEEDAAAVRMINEAKPDVVWIGLGAPKQENWMAAHRGRINAVMVGVGAGFNFYAGNIRRAPVWVQRMSMEWFYRLLQDPKRLFRRYLLTNAKFIGYTLEEKLLRRRRT